MCCIGCGLDFMGVGMKTLNEQAIKFVKDIGLEEAFKSIQCKKELSEFDVKVSKLVFALDRAASKISFRDALLIIDNTGLTAKEIYDLAVELKIIKPI